jgi:uncharacterized NAD(P)/FAD-binding protein YdhS
MKQLVIVGAGLSGRLLVLNLLRAAGQRQVSIKLIDRAEPSGMGPAYSADDHALLLNVPAGRMGAYSGDPGHFVKWVRARGISAGEGDFLPRTLFREYLLGLTRERLSVRETGVAFDQLQDKLIDIEMSGGAARVLLERNGSLVADKVVLALGNHPPRHPRVSNPSVLGCERYVQNPWTRGVFDSLSRTDSVGLIGTGQTTVDLAATLHRRGHEGRIVALSRRGMLPLVHRVVEPYPSFYEEIRDVHRIRELYKIVRRHLGMAERLGGDRRAVIDSLRPDTQRIWAGLPDEEKRRFLRHLFRYWEAIRSRIPPESDSILRQMRTSGQLDIRAGRIVDLVEKGNAIELQYIPRGGSIVRVERVQLVVNCIGPETDYNEVSDPLVKNLMNRGLIQPGPAGLGMMTTHHGAIIGRDGVESDVLYTLGSTMRGVLWEVLAVPEIRVQAEELAALLL